jgi:hypothetical protein
MSACASIGIRRAGDWRAAVGALHPLGGVLCLWGATTPVALRQDAPGGHRTKGSASATPPGGTGAGRPCHINYKPRRAFAAPARSETASTISAFLLPSATLA